jgi:hypothetical protein
MTIPPDPAFLDHLIGTLAGVWPSGGSAEDRRNAARAALEALQPRDLVEAMLAARMLAAHHASMDGFRRAMQPDISDAEAVRLRNSAIAAARSFDTALRALEKRQSAGLEPAPGRLTRGPPARDPQPLPEADAPFPSRPQFVPRDKHGAPIKLWRWEDMTMAQRRATYGDPADAELQAIALAEEAAMIEAEQDANRQVRGGG